MTGGSWCRRALGMVLAMLTAMPLAGCDVDFSASPDGDPPTVATRVPVGTPVPRGVLYGRVMHADGTAAPEAGVSVFQFDEADKVKAVAATASLGFFCLFPGDDFCPKAVGVDVSDDGLWSLRKADAKDVAYSTITADFPATAKRAADPFSAASGARTEVRLPDARDPQRVPDLLAWTPQISARPGPLGVRISWPALSGVPTGGRTTYAVAVLDEDDFAGLPQPLSTRQQGTSYLIPGWRTEDRAQEIVVTATTSVRGAAITYAAASTRIGSGPVPMTRGDRCLTDRDGVLLPARGRHCGLTNGNLDLQTAVRLPGERHQSHQVICVDLGRVRPIGLVVVRTPFGTSDMRAELSSDARTFTDLGPITRSTSFDDREVLPVPVSPARSARYVCVRDSVFGLNDSTLAEISAWPPGVGLR